MPNTFKNVLYECTGTIADVYTCPTATTAIVIGCQASNKVNTGDKVINVSVQSGATTEPLVKNVSVPQNSSLGCVAGKLVLEAGDKLRAFTGTTGDVSLIVSVLEIS